MGRILEDTLKIAGMEFKKNLVEKALAALGEEVEWGALHVYEEEEEGRVKPRFILKIRPRDEAFFDVISQKKFLMLFQEKLFVSQHRTLGDILRQGLARLELKILEKDSAQAASSLPILVDHRFENV